MRPPLRLARVVWVLELVKSVIDGAKDNNLPILEGIYLLSWVNASCLGGTKVMEGQSFA